MVSCSKKYLLRIYTIFLNLVLVLTNEEKVSLVVRAQGCVAEDQFTCFCFLNSYGDNIIFPKSLKGAKNK